MNDMPTIAPMGNEPNENSSLDELATYALGKQTQIIARDKRNREDLWLMGQALQWAKDKLPYGEWEKWWKAKGLKKTYVWQARKLHENAASLERVKELGLTEALLKFGVVAEKKAKESATAERPSKTTQDDDDPGESEQDARDTPKDDLADEEAKEHKEHQEAIRKLTPKTRAVAIQHALELLRDDLNGEEIDEDLQRTLGEIAQLAEELKRVSKKAA